jgi:hypothetical protein
MALDFLLIIGMVEQIFVYFIFRVAYFQSFVLVPQTKAYATTKYVDQNLVLQINALNVLIACIVLAHIGLILLECFHAIWGQYFYFRFLLKIQNSTLVHDQKQVSIGEHSVARS